MDFTTLSNIKSEVINRINTKCDHQHGLVHLEEVRKNALEIAKFYSVDSNLMEAICYLHDLTYTYVNPGIITYIFEGFIIENKLKEFLPKFNINKKEMRIIIKTCRKHPHSFPWGKLNKDADIYSQILQDADTLDFFSSTRVEGVLKSRFPAFSIFQRLITFAEPLIMAKYLNLPVSKKILREETCDIDSIPTYIEWNKECRETVVLIHGYADNAYMFNDLQDRFAHKHLIAINLPMNHSNWRLYDLVNLREYVQDIVTKLGIKKYSLVGFSLGGLIALKLAVVDNRVTDLTLLNIFPSMITNIFIKGLYKLLKPVLVNQYFLYLYSRLGTNESVRNLLRCSELDEETLQHLKGKYYSVFGTLFSCLDYDGIKDYLSLDINKSIVLARDDEVINVNRTLKTAHRKGIKINMVEEGGHNSKYNYWDKVEPLLAN